MAYNRNEREVNVDEFASFLQSAVGKVKTEENIEVLNKLKKVYKKNVPFTLRTYVAAYLAKELSSGGGRFYGRRRDSSRYDERGRYGEKSFFDSRNDKFRKDFYGAGAEGNEERPHRERIQVPEDQAATIFISIGRNKRVFPRDLIGILINVGGIERERIGDIRVLANYSFVQLYKDDADKVIAAINDYDYRGRKLSVSYSQKRSMYDEDEPEVELEAASAGEN